MLLIRLWEGHYGSLATIRGAPSLKAIAHLLNLRCERRDLLAANQEQDSDRQAQAEFVNYVAHVLVRVSVSCPDPGPGMEFGPGQFLSVSFPRSEGDPA